jgi:hypothetical protein
MLDEKPSNGKLSSEQAKAILSRGKEAGMYALEPPEDEKELIEEATIFLEQARGYGEDTEDVLAILELAKGSFHESIPERMAEVPFDDYDSLKITKIKLKIESGEADEYLDAIAAYEQTFKNRKRVLEYVEKRKEELEKEHEPQAEEAEPPREEALEREAEDAAPSIPDGAGESGQEGSEDSGEEDGDDGRRIVEQEYEELVKDAEKEHRSSWIHRAPDPEIVDIDIPYDVTQISDKKLQTLYSAYSALAYRINYLLALEEAKLRRVKLAVKEARAYLFAEAVKYDHQNHARTMTDINAHIDTDPVMKEWLLKENVLEANVESYRTQRDGYYREVDMLSRLATMRQQEAERSGHR